MLHIPGKADVGNEIIEGKKHLETEEDFCYVCDT